MMRGLFVTGTDTGIGKTVACGALLHGLRQHYPARYWKPIQTGIEADSDTETIRCLTGGAAGEVFDAGIRLPRPVSPHLAARLQGTTIDIDDLLALASARRPAERWIVEGAGGVLVPINDEALMVDLAVRLELPMVVVARTTLGTINHTLLTLEALRARSLTIAGVVLVGDPDAENRMAIERYGRTAVLGELRMLDPLTPEALRRAAAGFSIAPLVELLR